MPRGTHVLAILVAVLIASFLASCGGDDERFPPFEMTYTLRNMDGPEQIWQLDYRSADDWTKTLTESSNTEGMSVGRTARWDGERIAWAESPDGRFVMDQSPAPLETHAFPEFWFAPGNSLEALPNDFWVEIEPAREGTRRFRNEGRPQDAAGMPFQFDVRIVQTLTLDEQTGIPLGYENTGMHTLGIRFDAVDLEVK